MTEKKEKYNYSISRKRTKPRGRSTKNILRPVPNVVLLPCRTQMNLARQWHDKRTTVVSNVEFNSVAPRIEKKIALLETILNSKKQRQRQRQRQEHAKNTPRAHQEHAKSTPRARQEHAKSTPFEAKVLIAELNGFKRRATVVHKSNFILQFY